MKVVCYEVFNLSPSTSSTLHLSRHDFFVLKQCTIPDTDNSRPFLSIVFLFPAKFLFGPLPSLKYPYV